jgi:hypothetical protein
MHYDIPRWKSKKGFCTFVFIKSNNEHIIFVTVYVDWKVIKRWMYFDENEIIFHFVLFFLQNLENNNSDESHFDTIKIKISIFYLCLEWFQSIKRYGLVIWINTIYNVLKYSIFNGFENDLNIFTIWNNTNKDRYLKTIENVRKLYQRNM